MRYFRLPKVRFERLLAPKHTQHLSSDLTYSYTTSSTSRCLVTLHRLRSDCKPTLIAASMPIVCLSTGAGGNVVVTFHRFIHKILVASTTCGERVDTLISSRLIGMAITVSSRMLCSPLLTLQMHTSKAPSTAICNYGSYAQRSSQIPFGSLREMRADCTYFHDQSRFRSRTLGNARRYLRPRSQPESSTSFSS